MFTIHFLVPLHEKKKTIIYLQTELNVFLKSENRLFARLFY